jgi:hypothetical protein
MSQYKSSMFSDAVYLFGTTFSSAPSWHDLKEELPDGTKVDQNKLARQAVLAAFAYLYNKKLIDIVLEEGKVLFMKTKTAKVKKLQSSAPDTSGLEAVIFTHIQDNSNISGIIHGLFRSDVPNPWGDVLQIVKKNLLDRGILKQVEKGKVLFITRYKNVVNEDFSKEEKQVTELKKTLEELQSKGELYKIILSEIASGISSRRHVPDTGGV